MRIPFSAPLPVPTMIAVGVARPMAHGQAMISTAIALASAKASFGSGPRSSQPTKVSAAIAMTAGTNQPVTRSATRWIGAFEPCARSTRATIWARAVSRPDALGAHDERAAGVDGGADGAVADALVDRQRLAGQHRLVDGRGAVDQDSVDRHAVAGPHAHEVAGDDLVDRDLALAALAQHPGGVRPQLQQRLDGAGRLALGTGLEPAAEQDRGR